MPWLLSDTDTALAVIVTAENFGPPTWHVERHLAGPLASEPFAPFRMRVPYCRADVCNRTYAEPRGIDLKNDYKVAELSRVSRDGFD